MKKQSIASTLVAALALCGAGTVHAQTAGSVMVKVGWNKITPKVDSGDLSAPAIPGSQINIQSASAAIITATYMYTDNISFEFLGGLPYKHTVVGAGAVSGVGSIGTIHQISPTALIQYRLGAAQAPLRPYLSAGLSWARFYGTDGTAALTALTNPGGPPTLIGSESRFGFTFGGGLNYKIDDHWFLDAAVLKTLITTDTTLSTGQTISAKLNPLAVNASVGYTF